MVRPLFRTVALAAVSIVILLPACGGVDGPAGGGNVARLLTIPAGNYDVTTQYFGCDGSPGFPSVYRVVACRSETLEDFMDVAGCPVERTGNALSIDCVSIRDHSDGCVETVRMRFVGSVNGDVYELRGTIRSSDSPPDCWDGAYCDSLSMRLVKSGDAPAECDYADVDQIALRVDDGPLAGSHALAAVGVPSGGGNAISWTFNGYEWGARARQSSGTSTGDPPLFMTIATGAIDPADLPVTLPVYVGVFPQTVSGGPEAYLNYNEYSESHRYFATDVTGGSIVVESLGPNIIAGTFDLQLSGTMERTGGVSTASRGISGGFHVTHSDPTHPLPHGTRVSAKLSPDFAGRRALRTGF